MHPSALSNDFSKISFATSIAASIGLTLPAFADPPDHAPAHGWRKKHDPYYLGYTGHKWERDYGIVEGRCNRQRVRWVNETTSVSYVVRPLTSDRKASCRNFELAVSRSGKARTEKRRACRTGEGNYSTWMASYRNFLKQQYRFQMSDSRVSARFREQRRTSLSA